MSVQSGPLALAREQKFNLFIVCIEKRNPKIKVIKSFTY